MATLQTSFLGIQFENPFLLASAPPTSKVESIDKAFEAGWGGAVLKTITPDDLIMNEASPRYQVQRHEGKIIGFQNIELLSHKSLKYWLDGIRFLKNKHPNKVVIASIMAPQEKEKWQALVRAINDTPADAFELNFSCPHGMPEKKIGMAIGASRESSKTITAWVKEAAKKPVFVKLTPNVTDISRIALAVQEAGADGVTAINTAQGFMGVDLDSLEPRLNIDGRSAFGGCSGPIIKAIGFRCVAQIRQASALPILASGGISDWSDAAQYIALGADAVQVCSEVMLNGYEIIGKMKDGLLKYLESKSFASINDIKGAVVKKITSHESLNKTCMVLPSIDKSKCVLCKKCVSRCSESESGALSVLDGAIKVDKGLCFGCSLCSHVCPQGAINMTNRLENARLMR